MIFKKDLVFLRQENFLPHIEQHAARVPNLGMFPALKIIRLEAVECYGGMYIVSRHLRTCWKKEQETANKMKPRVLVIDVGGTHVKVLASGQRIHRKFVSGPALTPKQMVAGVRKLVADWKYEVISMGYPGAVLHGRPVAEPRNLGKGWVGFDFKKAFKRPVRILNDAAMQALGSYQRGKMLFLGLGTGLGSALVVERVVYPMELAHLPYRKGTFEDYVGLRGLEKYGKKKWRRHVAEAVELLAAALQSDEIVLGGGNVRKLKKLPPSCRTGDNANAFIGGFRLWEKAEGPVRSRRSTRQARGRLMPDLKNRSNQQTLRLTRNARNRRPDRTGTRSRHFDAPSRRRLRNLKGEPKK